MAKATKKAKKTGTEASVSKDRQRLYDTVATLQANKGKRSLTIVGTESRYALAGGARISTGCLALDYATGGGIPEGLLTNIYGEPEAGKTSLAYAIGAQAQRKCRKCRSRIRTKVSHCALHRTHEDGSTEKINPEDVVKNWNPLRFFLEASYRKAAEKVFKEAKIEPDIVVEEECKCKGLPEPYKIALAAVEKKYDHSWGNSLGLNGDDLVIVEGESGNDTIDILDGLLRAEVVDLVILDSIASMESTAEIQKPSAKERPGIQAKMVNEALRKWGSALTGFGPDPTRPTMVCINQTRHQVGLVFGNPTFRTGGRGQLFAGVLDIEVRKGKHPIGKFKGKPVSLDSAGRPVTQYVKFKITKCQAGPGNAEGSYPLFLRPHQGRSVGSTDDEWATAKFAEMLGVFGPSKDLLGKTFPSLEEMVDAFFDDNNYFWDVRSEVLSKMLEESTDWMKFKASKHRRDVPTTGKAAEDEAQEEDWVAEDIEFD